MKKKEYYKDELSRQYNILIKAEKKAEKKRTISLLIIFAFTFIATIFSFIYSYKAYKNTNNILSNKEKTSQKYFQTLNITYNDGQNFNTDNITTNFIGQPKIITITNEGNTKISYDIILDKISSSFASTNNLQYQISSNNEETFTKSLPLTKTSIIKDMVISPQETNTYVINIKYSGSIENNNTSNYYHSTIKVEQNNSNSSLLE